MSTTSKKVSLIIDTLNFLELISAADDDSCMRDTSKALLNSWRIYLTEITEGRQNDNKSD